MASILTGHGWWRYAVAATLTMLISGCGGGGSDSASTGGPAQVNAGASDYVVIADNANNGIILDGAGNQFAQTKYSNTLYAIAIDRYLSGLTVGSGGQIYDQGKQVASVILDVASDGRKVAYLACSGPAPNFGKMTITLTDGGYSYSCASNTGQGNNPTPPGSVGSGGNNSQTGSPNGTLTTQPTSHIDDSAKAVQCLQRGTTSSGFTITNTCNYTIQYSYCNVLPDSNGSSIFQCKAVATSFSPTGYTYDQGSSGLAPGGTASVLGSNRPGNIAFVAACRGSIGEISPHIVSIDSNRGTFSMICYR